MYALVENNQIVELHDELPASWKNISGLPALSSEQLVSHGWYKVELDNRTVDQESFLVDTQYNISGNVVKQVHNIQLIKENTAFVDRLWDAIRIKRDRMMRDNEWRYYRHHREVRLGLTPTEELSNLDEYMQALADVTKQADPINIAWPVIK